MYWAPPNSEASDRVNITLKILKCYFKFLKSFGGWGYAPDPDSPSIVLNVASPRPSFEVDCHINNFGVLLNYYFQVDRWSQPIFDADRSISATQSIWGSSADWELLWWEGPTTIHLQGEAGENLKLCHCMLPSNCLTGVVTVVTAMFCL